MGVCYSITIENDFSPRATAQMDGKALAALDRALDQGGVYANGLLRPLHSFFGDPLDLDELADSGIEGVDPKVQETTWFDAADGIACVRALLGHLSVQPVDGIHQDWAIEELGMVLADLTKCRDRGLRWHLSIHI